MAEKEEETKTKSFSSPYDLDGQQFNSDMYMQKLFKVSIIQCLVTHDQWVASSVYTSSSNPSGFTYSQNMVTRTLLVVV